MKAAFAAEATSPKDPTRPVLKIGGETLVTAGQLAAEMRYAPPPLLQQVRNSDSAARAQAVEWYSRVLMAKAAKEDGTLERRPGLAAAAQARANGLIATEYLEEYVQKRSKPTDQEVRQYYELNESICSEPARIQLASIAVVVGKNGSESEKAGARERVAKIEEKLAAGEEFGRVADELSDRPGRAPGGDLGWLSVDEIGKLEGASEMLSLEKGQVQKVERAGGEVLFFKVLDKQAARRLPLEECRADVEQAINTAYRQELALRLIDELAERFGASIDMDAFAETVRGIELDPQWLDTWNAKKR